MEIPEALKIEPHMAVVFKKHFEFNGVKCNAIYQHDDGTLVFFDTDTMHTSGNMKVAYKEIEGDLKL